MRVFECKISYSLVSLGEEVRLDCPDKITDYLRSAFDENQMQEAFYCVYLDRGILLPTSLYSICSHLVLEYKAPPFSVLHVYRSTNHSPMLL
jgi:hypothetical protein